MIEAIIRSSLVLLAGLGLAALMRSRSAAVRHCVLAIALSAAVIVIPMARIVPAVPVPVPGIDPDTAVEIPIVDVSARTATVASTASAPTAVTPVQQGPDLLVLVWAAGVVFCLAQLAGALLRFRAVLRHAAPVSAPSVVALLHEIAALHDVRRQVRLLRTDRADMLATSGLVRPVIVLPAHAREWSEPRLRSVLVHELAHVSRADWFIQTCAEILCAFLWFNPLVWVVARQLRREAERACDDVVLTSGVPARQYAQDLIELVSLCRPRTRWVSAAPMARASTLERRIAAMLDSTLDRSRVSRPIVAITVVVLFALALPIAALRAAQGAGNLTGVVYDATGGVLPGVAVTLDGSGDSKWAATTNAGGRFDLPSIPAGAYVLSVSLPGFRTLRQQFELRNARDWDRAITLQVGDVSESIVVQETRLTQAGAPQPQMPPPVRVGGNIRVPRKTVDVKPVYPVAMREAGREGVVPIEAIIGKDGSVTSVRVTSAQVHPDFAIAAIDAVRQWRFTPTLLNGAPVEIVMTVNVAFNLAD